MGQRMADQTGELGGLGRDVPSRAATPEIADHKRIQGRRRRLVLAVQHNFDKVCGLRVSNFQETGRWHIDQHWELKNGYEFHTGTNITREGVVR